MEEEELLWIHQTSCTLECFLRETVLVTVFKVLTNVLIIPKIQEIF
jgi:hypothetical protein